MTDTRNKMLLVVDPQVDFISGTLPVPGARRAMDALALYITEHGADYAATVITVDWHPYDHSSFADKGGQWPRHCVAYSQGAAIYEPVMRASYEHCPSVTILAKGTLADKEEYSVMGNDVSADILRSIIATLDIDHIDVCGLAGDICVANTARDIADAYGADRITILEAFSPRIN